MPTLKLVEIGGSDVVDFDALEAETGSFFVCETSTSRLGLFVNTLHS